MIGMGYAREALYLPGLSKRYAAVLPASVCNAHCLHAPAPVTIMAHAIDNYSLIIYLLDKLFQWHVLLRLNARVLPLNLVSVPCIRHPSLCSCPSLS